MKESNPIEVDKYVTACIIQDDNAFVWWVPITLRKRDRIISSFNFRTRKATHKYGIEIPMSIKHAEAIYKSNKNTFCQDAINLEMSNIYVAFKILDTGETPLPRQETKWTHDLFREDGLYKKIKMGKGWTPHSRS